MIVTRGHKEDMRVLAWAVRTEARYIGMIGSKRKVISVYKALEKEGYSPEEFERVYAPMGWKSARCRRKKLPSASSPN